MKKVPFPLLGSESQGRSRGLGGEGRGGQFSWVPVYSLLTSDQGCHKELLDGNCCGFFMLY